MKKIALTGNIGSGKSTVARVFEILDIPVYKADDVGHYLLKDKNVIAKVSAIFGEKVISNGSVERKLLAEIVFKDSEAIKKLNAIIHPRVMDNFNAYVKSISKVKYIIFESAIIFEADLNHLFDESILVYAPDEMKIVRVMKRDNCNRNSVLARLSNQINDDLKREKVNHIILNDDVALVIPQVLELHSTFELQ